jgi:hypothetical protein
VRDAQGLLFVRRPREVDLNRHGLVLATALTEGGQNAPKSLPRLRDRDQPIGPTAHPTCRLGTDGRAE